MDATYEYALIRVVPDRRRGEWANVGVCVFLRDRLDIRIHPNTSKLRVLAPSLDLGFLQHLPQLWSRIAEGDAPAQERHALLKGLPLAHASPLGAFIAPPERYEVEVESILRDLVIPPPAPVRALREPRLITSLKHQFIRSKLYSPDPKDIERHCVVQNYPIEAGAGLYADFALQNGALRITETIDFRVNPDTLRSAKHGQAAIKAITLNKAAQLHRRCVPSVVYAVNPEHQDLVQPSLNLLAGYAERLYDATNRNDMADYMEMMQAAARAT